MRRLPWLLVVIALLTGGLAACGDKSDEMAPDVLLTVNGEPIKTQDLQRAWAAMPDQSKQEYVGPQGLKKLIDELVVWKLLAQRAREKGLDQNADIKERVKNFEENLLVNSLLDEGITDEEIFKYYNSHYVHGYFILVKVGDDASTAAKQAAEAKAKQLYEELKGGAKFEDVVNREIDKKENVGGGDMGYVTHDDVQYKAGFDAAEALFGLSQAGDLTPPIKGNGGWYIFYLVEPMGNLNPAGLNPDIAGWYRDQKRQEVIRSYHNQLKTDPDIKIEQNEQAYRNLIEQLQPAWDEMNKENQTGTAAGSTAAPAPGGTAPAPGGTAP